MSSGVDGARGVGIASATLLVATLLWQLRLQWRKGTAEGVSRFLFVGQLGASIGFATYSSMIGDQVFVVTNIAIGLAAIAGAVLTAILRHRAHRARARSWRARDRDDPTASRGHAPRAPARVGSL